MTHKLKEWLYIGVGGALGTWLRATIAQLWATTTFPFSTLFVNLLGSFLLGGFTAYLYHRTNQTIHLLFGIGFCGSFTTMSMFAADATILMSEESLLLFTIYISCSVIFGVFLAFMGYLLINHMLNKKVMS